MNANKLLLVASLLFLSGCATLARIEPVKRGGQVLEYRQGRAILVSGGRRSAVGILPEAAQYQIGQRLSFRLRVENYGESILDFSEANIFAAMNGKAIPIIPVSQLAYEIQETAKWARVSAVLAGVAAQMNAANSGYTNYYGTTSTPGYGTGTFSGTIYDPAKAQLAQTQASQQTGEQLAQIDVNEEAAARFVQGALLQRTTLHQGDAIQGHFVVQMPAERADNNSIDITVNVGEDIHHLSFTETQIQQ